MIVVDTGPLIALVDHDDVHHAACRKWFVSTRRRNLVVPPPVIAEACYVLGSRVGSDVEAAFLEDLARGMYGMVAAIMPDDLLRMSQLVSQYANLPLGGTDACVVAVAERLRTTNVATVDRRHFTVVRPSHAPAFTLYPETL